MSKKTSEHMSTEIIGQVDATNSLTDIRQLSTDPNISPAEKIRLVKSFLNKDNIFKTLQHLRWPQGVVCPKCRSTRVVAVHPPKDASDDRQFYQCLICDTENEDGGGFDDLTGLPITSIQMLQQWLLCWYLLGFCSMTQISKILGISIHEVLMLIDMNAHLITLPKHKEELSFRSGRDNQKKTDFHKKIKETADLQSEYTKSESKQPFKPGPKSKY